LNVVNLNPEQVEVKIFDPRTKKPIPHKLRDNGNGTMDIVFTPTVPGMIFHKSDV
jgi:hypothetical protein